MDWLSQLLDLVPVQGQLDIRCAFNAPWRIDHAPAEQGEIQYHVLVEGAAVLEDPADGTSHHLVAGDILILPHGGAHILHDGGGAAPMPVRSRAGTNLIIKENGGAGAPFDMLCGRFLLAHGRDRLLRTYLPSRLIVRAVGETATATSGQLAMLISTMRTEVEHEQLGGRAMLNALSAALFALALRRAGDALAAPTGLLALVGSPRLAPAVAALFNEPSRAWTLPALAALCHMSRATFARRFQESFGRSANDLLTDIRMTLAGNALRETGISTAAAAELAGYQSDAAFQRTFRQRMGITPAKWRGAASSRV